MMATVNAQAALTLDTRRDFVAAGREASVASQGLTGRERELGAIQAGLSERERELGAIIGAYSAVTERLKDAHDRLNREVALLREELCSKNAELRRRDRLAALGEMAAGLAHEVRNPLGGIVLYSSMLEKRLAQECCCGGLSQTAQPSKGGAAGPQRGSQLREAAAKITLGVRSLERLVGEILDFAQEDRLEREHFPLGRIFGDLELGIQTWVAEFACRIDLDPTAAAVRVYADRPRLVRVLLNLLVNGVQAAGGRTRSANGEAARRAGERTQAPKLGRVGLRARAARGERGADRGACIEVWDDGPGVASGELDRIFNPFYTTKSTGTGLGLAIVHRIVEAHGGSIRVRSRSGGGARFVVRLPSAGQTTEAKGTGRIVGPSSSDLDMRGTRKRQDA